MYSALSQPPDDLVGTEPNDNIYYDEDPLETGRIKVSCGIKGVNVSADGKKSKPTTMVEIAYTRSVNTSEILVVFLHGVPTSRKQWYPVLKRLSRFVEVFCFDMLGMGESSMVLRDDISTWKWKNDVIYIENMMQKLYPNRKFVFVADDWGGGIAVKYAEKHPERLLALSLLNPIAFDGYPVSEIQAIGRLSQVSDDPKVFGLLTAAFDQTLVQIYKTMVHNPAKFNQYSLRTIKGPYAAVDYERKGASSLSLKLNTTAIRVLADRSSILAPGLLLPYDLHENPEGVDYDKITCPVQVMGGMYDDMMPEAQRHRYQWAMRNTSVQLIRIPEAGHYAGIDQPEFVAESILNFIIEKLGRDAVEDIFLGFKDQWTIWKGDEPVMIEKLRELYGKL